MASGQQIELGDLLTNSKSGRFLVLRGADGAPPSWLSPEWLKIIWHPAAYGDQEARRVNVCFEPDAAAADFFAGLERELVDCLAGARAQDLQQGAGAPGDRGPDAVVPQDFLKAKLNWDRVRFWDAEGQPTNLQLREAAAPQAECPF